MTLISIHYPVFIVVQSKFQFVTGLSSDMIPDGFLNFLILFSSIKCADISNQFLPIIPQAPVPIIIRPHILNNPIIQFANTSHLSGKIGNRYDIDIGNRYASK